MADNGRVSVCLLPDCLRAGRGNDQSQTPSSATVMDVFDSRNIQDRSLLKVYNKDPSHAFNHMAKAVNGDVRVSTPVLVLTVFPFHTVSSHTRLPRFPGPCCSSHLVTFYWFIGKTIRFPGHLEPRDENGAGSAFIH